MQEILITMYDPQGNVIFNFDIEPLSNNPNESYTRNPDITGETFEQHSAIASFKRSFVFTRI